MPPANKRRKLAPGQVEELTFDISARQEYLSGFHKRKQARIQHARDVAVKREREERVRERRQIREQRREELQQHVEAVNAELKKQKRVLDGKFEDHSSDDEGESGEQDWDGIDGATAEGEQLEQEEEYVDEDKYTTVTVEPMGDSDSGGEVNRREVADADDSEQHVTPNESQTEGKKPGRSRTKQTSENGAKARSKKKKFRYESKAERAAGRQKQRSKNRVAKARRKGD